MFKGNSSSLLSKNSVHLVRYRYGAMMTAGAAQCDGQAVLSFLDIARKQFLDELGCSVYELLGNVMLQDILGDFFVVSRKFL